MDVKFVPNGCVTNGKKYYEYIAAGECSRWAYRQMYEGHSTYSPYLFLMELVKEAPFQIREIQTDSGTEFTKALLSKNPAQTMFEEKLEELGIIYHRTRVATPRHNGERFYSGMKMHSLADGRKQLAIYKKKSNNYIKTCLNMKSPDQVVEEYLGVM